MNDWQYVVVRYIADEVRNEPCNIGIILWDGDQSYVRLDSEACERVLRLNPHAHKDSLSRLDTFLNEHLRGRGIEDYPDIPHGMPFEFTETRDAPQNRTLDDALNILCNRLVSPPRKPAIGGRPDPTVAVKRELKYYLDRKLIADDHIFPHSHSGKPRQVSFFGKQGGGFCVDVVSLALTRGSEIADRAHAKAFIQQDILKANNELTFFAYCLTNRDERVREATEDALASFESVGVHLLSDAKQVKDVVEMRVGNPRLLATAGD